MYQILEEIEREDEIEDLSDVDSPQEAGQSGVPLFVTSEVELLTGKQNDGTDRAGEFEEQSTLEPGMTPSLCELLISSSLYLMS